MNKSGWRDLIARYYAATDLVHDKDQFKSKLRQLRHLWHFINDLRKASGLGKREDGSMWQERNQKIEDQTKALERKVELVL